MRIMAKFALPQDNWKNVVEHSLLVAIAAGLTYLTGNVGKTDFGTYTPIVVAVASVLVTYIKKVIDNKVDDVPPFPVNPVNPEPVIPIPTPPDDDEDGMIDFPMNG